MIDELERMKKEAAVTGTCLEGPTDTTKGPSHDRSSSSKNSNRVTSQPMARLASTFTRALLFLSLLKCWTKGIFGRFTLRKSDKRKKWAGGGGKSQDGPERCWGDDVLSSAGNWMEVVQQCIAKYLTGWTILALALNCVVIIQTHTYNIRLWYVSVPHQLERVGSNANRSAMWRFYWDLLIGDAREANDWREHTREYNSVMSRRLSRHLVRTISGCMARFTISSNRYIQERQIHVCQDMENFTFSILLKQHQNGFRTSVWPKWREDWVTCCDKLTHLHKYNTLIFNSLSLRSSRSFSACL